MRNFHKIVGALALFVLSAGTASADTKIITIRGGDIVQASPLFKTGQAQFKAEFEKRKADLETEARKLGEDAKKFQREADVMSSDARAKMEKDLQARKIDFDYKQRQLGEDAQKRERELYDKLMASIKQVVVEVAKEQGADLVLQDPVFSAPGIDVTDQVIKRLQASTPPAK
ncbi:MAG: OmpH family outer membrane protein [Panacagrimonas sp.]